MSDSKLEMGNWKSPAEPAAAAIFGIPFHDTSLGETLDEIDQIVANRKASRSFRAQDTRSFRAQDNPCYVVTPNLDFAAQASADPDLHRIILGAHRILCDGMPLVWASRILGAPLARRVAGSDLVPLLAERAAGKGHRLYFLGSTREVLEKARDILNTRYPGLQVTGMDSPPHAPLEAMNHSAIAEKIRAAKPDILLVAFGCPKQEKWIAMNFRNLGVPCSIGIGASLDFIAGKTQRAPRWMQSTGTEWIFRLLQEPGRLLRRYSWDFCFLVAALARHLSMGGSSVCAVDALTSKSAWSLTESAETLTADLSGISSLDLWQFGSLLRLYYAAQSSGRELTLLNPSDAVRELLRLSRVDRVIKVENRRAM